MEVDAMMSRRQIEASRETRLWITQVLLPVVGITMLIPEARNAVVAKVKEVKDKITSKIQH
jgi:hypothetical protein